MRTRKFCFRHRTPMHVLKLAMQLEKEIIAGHEAYLLECIADLKNGHRPHYCEHGTDQWTDWDNICGGCEDGFSMGNPMHRKKRALEVAKMRYNAADEVWATTQTLRRAGIELTPEQKAKLRELTSYYLCEMWQR